MQAPRLGVPRLVVIVGPTGAGKTRLSLALAAATGGEVISCDSQQVYLGMDIGTGKATADERARIAHHLLDVVEPDQEMTAARFIAMADAAIAEIAARGKPIIVVGGTGLYVRALLLGLFEGPPASPELRAELATLGIAALRDQLERVDPAAAAKIEKNDEKRMIRALEVFRLTGEPMSAHQARHDHRTLPRRYDARLIGLSPERDDLYKAIDARVDEMIAAGFVADGEVERARGIELIKRNSRHYARRQLSWYRSDATIQWSPNPAAVDLDDVGRYLAGL